MPGGDRTGPNGMGPMTGRGAGYCGGYPVPGCGNGAGGRGLAAGRGFAGMGGRRGLRNRFWATGLAGWQRAAMAPAAFGAADAAEQLQAVQQQADNLRQALDDIGRVIADLQGKAGKDAGASNG